jgi:putative transposase
LSDDAVVSRRQIIDDQLYAHFITFSCDRRRRLLSLDEPKRIILKVLRQELQRISAKCVGYVIMPDHVHSIIWFSTPGCLSQFMHAWKRYSSRLIRQWYRVQKMRYFEKAEFGERFWQPKYHAFAIYDERKLAEKLEYMHNNPVRAGLVETAADWLWSSARWYARRITVGVPIEWVR